MRWDRAMAMLAGVAAALAGGAQDEVVVRPDDTGAALANPRMGWVFHYYDNVPSNYGSRLAPSDTLDDFPGLTVVYLRIPWSWIEPREGEFNWSVLDTPAQRWIARGRQVALRISCSESWTRWATPEWVQQAGAKGYNFRPGTGVVDDGPFWEPDYDDPVFLDKLDRFLAAMAARYDGSPEVAFIDVGSFGVWGEGHLHSSTRLKYPAETVARHIDLHLKHFPHTLLAANDDFVGQGQETIQHALEHGLTLRDDSILVQPAPRAYFHADMAQAFWPSVPVILESEHYGGSRDRGNWQDGSLYLQAVEDYHASYVSIHWWPREFLEENRELVDRINRRLGYRLQLAEARWPAAIRRGAPLPVSLSWRNAGVAPCYPGGYAALTLRDEQGGLAAVLVDDALDVRTLPVGLAGRAEARTSERSFGLPFQLRGGRYQVLVSVGSRTGTPTIALPLPGDDGQRRYRIGELRVRGDYDVQAGEPRQEGDGWMIPVTWTIHAPLPAGVRPFLHFEEGGKIVFQGGPAGDAAALSQPGEVAVPMAFPVPAEARGRTFEAKLGLYDPAQFGKPDERMHPDQDAGDRRVLLGRLTVAPDGAVTYVAAP